MSINGLAPHLPEACKSRFRTEPAASRPHWHLGEHLSLENRTAAELRSVFTLVRSPRTRLASGFHWAHRLEPRLNATEGEICAFVRSGAFAVTTRGAQTKMIVGHRILFDSRNKHHFVSPAPPGPALAEEACRRLQHFAFVGLSDHWAASVCLFHAMFGGLGSEAEHVNTRKGQYTSVPESAKEVDCGDAADDRLFKCALQLFEQRLDSLAPHCRQHLPSGRLRHL